jgi:chemotaxis protein histidine kinase CheA
VSTLLEQASVWADREHKRVRIDVEGRDTPVPPALAEVLGGAITHMVRNAIAHGIETVDERMTLGKPPVGMIRLECQRSEASGVRVSVDDDGRGVSNRELLGHVSQRSGVLKQLGHASLSSLPRPTEIAGHGVGLSAVQADLSRVGYGLSVAARVGGGSRFEIRPGAGVTP